MYQKKCKKEYKESDKQKLNIESKSKPYQLEVNQALKDFEKSNKTEIDKKILKQKIELLEKKMLKNVKKNLNSLINPKYSVYTAFSVLSLS